MEERERMGREGRRRVTENWSIEALVKIHEEHFDRILEAKRGA